MKPQALIALLVLGSSCMTVDPAGLVPDLAAQLPSNCDYVDPKDHRFVACAGSFQAGGAAALCPSGYTTQVPAISGEVAAACDSYKAKGAFFAVDIAAWNDPLAPATSSSCVQMQNWLHGLMGCGGIPNAVATPNCQGWPVEVVCSKTADWTCQEGLATAANKNPQHGVVCYKPGA